jgi:PAS domain S-box-containing protein
VRGASTFVCTNANNCNQVIVTSHECEKPANGHPLAGKQIGTSRTATYLTLRDCLNCRPIAQLLQAFRHSDLASTNDLGIGGIKRHVSHRLGCSMSISPDARWWRSSAILNYGLAVLSFAVTFACVTLLARILDAAPPVALFLCAIIFVARLAGLGPALLTAGLSALAFGYFYLPPSSLMLASKDTPRIVVFAVACAFVAAVSAAQRNAEHSLRRARDQLQDAVVDLTTLNDQLRHEIADRTAAEQKTREAERELQITIDTIPTQVTSYRPDGSREFVNRAWQEFTGISRRDAVGRTWAIAVHPDDFEAGDLAWRRSLATGQPFQMQLRFRRADGEYRWQLVQRVPLRSETGDVIKWYSVASDIEDQKRAEDSLRKSEAYLDQAQQLSRTGSFGWNVATGKIVWSKEAYQILGIDRAVTPTLELVMQHIPLDEYEFARTEIDRCPRDAPNFEYEHRWVCPDGLVKQIHVRAHRVSYESGEEEIVGALMDVTEARRAEQAMADAQAQLAQANRVATLGQMSASIAHEVNQPLAAIVIHGAANLRLLTGPTPDIDEVRRGLEQMIADAERASNVVNRIRALSKKNKPERTLLDINEVITDVIKLVNREIVSHQISLRLDLAATLPPVPGDRVQLQQVIINLVVNGIQAMADKRVRNLVIRSRACDSDQVMVLVQDSGIGIDAKNANRLFDPFYTTKPSGMGMGLSICRSIIEAHGGRIWASGHDGAGAMFQFVLPTR